MHTPNNRGIWSASALSLLFVCLLFLCSDSIAQQESSDTILVDTVEPTVLDLINKFRAGHYKNVSEFIVVSVFVQSDTSLGLDEEDLTDYARLRFKNNFADIPLNHRLGNIPASELTEAQRENEYGVLSFFVWTVGTDYPVAYHISISGGTTDESSLYENAYLGYCSNNDIEDAIKKVIDDLMEGFAIEFFKLRGEL